MDATASRQPEPAHEVATNWQSAEPALLTLLRRRDPDRLLLALFAPSARRFPLAALYAFHGELCRIPEVVSEPTLGLIRLAWWREVVDGARPRHEVATPLAMALACGGLDRAALRELLAAREEQLTEPPREVAAWQRHIAATEGALAALAGRALGADTTASERLAALGAAYGVGRLLRRQAAPVELAAWGRGQLAQAGGPLPRPLLAAGLIGVFARRDLARLAHGGQRAAARPRGLGDRLAVLAAALLGHV